LPRTCRGGPRGGDGPAVPGRATDAYMLQQCLRPRPSSRRQHVVHILVEPPGTDAGDQGSPPWDSCDRRQTRQQRRAPVVGQPTRGDDFDFFKTRRGKDHAVSVGRQRRSRPAAARKRPAPLNQIQTAWSVENIEQLPTGPAFWLRRALRGAFDHSCSRVGHRSLRQDLVFLRAKSGQRPDRL